MSNPNRQHFSVEPDDERSISDSEPLAPKAPITPDNLRFLFDKQKSEEAAFRQYENDGEDADIVGPGKRRKKAARSLKGLFKTRNLAAKAEKKAAKMPPAFENVVPLDSYRKSAAEDIREVEAQDVTQESGADVQETFRVDPDAADSPDHQDREDAERGVLSSHEDDAPVHEAAALAGSGGSGYDGPPPPPVPPSSRPDRPRVEDYLPPSAVHEPIRILPAPVERRGGVTGPLTAFFAANYLSRRRNRRARKETNKLKAELKDTQRQQQAESSRLRSIEDSIRNNSPVPTKPSVVESKKPAVTPVAAESSPTKVSEILAAAAVNKNNLNQTQPQQEQSTFIAKEVTPQLPAPTAPEKHNQASKEAPKSTNTVKEVAESSLAKDLKQLNKKQLDQGKAIESLQERQQAPSHLESTPQIKYDNNRLEAAQKLARHESHDTKPSPQFKSSAGAPASIPSAPPVGSTAAAPTRASREDAATVRTSHQPMIADNRQKDLYKKSMRAGIVTGLVIASLGVLAYVVLL